MGDSFIWIEAGSRARNGVRYGARGDRTLILDDATAIVEQVPLVKSMSPNADGHTQVVYGGENWVTMFRGVTPVFLQIRRWNTRLGEFFTEADVDATAPVCVLGQTVVDNLFGNEDPIGKTIRVHSMPCKVVGVLQAKGFSATGQDQDDFIVMPFTTVQKRITGTFWLDDIFCSAVSREAMPEATKQIVALLRERHHLNPTEADDFNIRRPEDVVQAQLATSDAFAATSAAASAARCTSPFATYKVTTSIAKAAIASRVTIVRATRTMVCPCSPECVAIALFLMNSFLSWSQPIGSKRIVGA